MKNTEPPEVSLFRIDQAVRLYPDEPRIHRARVKFGEKTKAPWLYRARLRLHELEPENAELTWELARQSIAAGDETKGTQRATTLLNNPKYAADARNLLGVFSIRAGKPEEAAKNFELAYGLKPESSAILKNYIAVLLNREPADLPRIQSLITQLEKIPEEQVAAERFKMMVALREGRIEEALTISRGVVRDSRHALSDDLERISLEAQVSPELAEKALDELLEQIANKQSDPQPVIVWLYRNGHFARLTSFIDTLPEQQRERSPIRIAKVEALLKLGKFSEVAHYLEDKDWGDEDFMRQFYLATSHQAAGNLALAEKARFQAVEAVFESNRGQTPPAAAARLLKLLESQEGWDKEREQLYWKLSEFPSIEEATLQRLFELHRNTRNAAGLAQVADRLTNSFSANRTYANNAVYLGLLTNPESKRLLDSAQTNAKSAPNDSQALSNYAYALLLNGQPKEALQVFEQIAETDRGSADFALSKGLILKALGELQQARRILETVDRSKLLDLEENLLDAALRDLPKTAGTPPPTTE